MGDYFFNNLPVGHAIRTLSLAAATTSLGTEPAVAGAVGPTVDDARRQCAAVSWLLGDDYSKAAVLALPAASRNYLLKLLNLSYAPRTANAQADRIANHRATHHPDLDGGAAGDGQGSGSAGGGVQGDDTGGFAPALLPPPQVAALLAIPRGEITKLLDAAGVPHNAADADADLRTKCAAAAWAAEKIRSSRDVRALAPGVQDRMLTAFGVHAAWKPEARHQALINVLHTCRDAAWSLDPQLSHGLVHQERSQLFR
jgi:hypothetical protein